MANLYRATQNQVEDDRDVHSHSRENVRCHSISSVLSTCPNPSTIVKRVVKVPSEILPYKVIEVHQVDLD